MTQNLKRIYGEIMRGFWINSKSADLNNEYTTSPLSDRGAVYRTSELTAMHNHQDAATQELVGFTPVSAGTNEQVLCNASLKSKFKFSD